MSVVRRTKWFIHECPLRTECSDQVWYGKCKQCKSWESEEDCRAKLKWHLEKSAKHAETVKENWLHGNEDYVDRIVADAVVVSEDDVYRTEEVAQPHGKKARRNEDAWGPWLAEEDEPTFDPNAAASTGPDDDELRLMMQAQANQLALVEQQRAAGMVQVPLAKLKAMLDSVERAVRVTQHAARLADGARQAFEAETRSLQDTARDIAREVDRAAGQLGV
jgi:hypothetical protein